jgi:hypothetical protein
MYHLLFDSEIHANHRRAELIADRARVRCTLRNTLLSTFRHAIGRSLITLGERLAERDHRPAPSAPVHGVALRPGS